MLLLEDTSLTGDNGAIAHNLGTAVCKHIVDFMLVTNTLCP